MVTKRSLSSARPEVISTTVCEKGIHVLCAVQPISDNSPARARRRLSRCDVVHEQYREHVNSAIVTGMWAASRGLMTVKEVVRRHGYDGAQESEISGKGLARGKSALRKLLDA